MTTKVSTDASGGDFGFPVTIEAGLSALSLYSDLCLNFVGDESGIQQELEKHAKYKSLIERISITHASEVIDMGEAPSHALRRKKDSSMRVATTLLHDTTVDACVSAVNTGALMAVSRFVLKTISGVDRPAIMANLPTYTGHTHMLDVGANIDSKPET